MPPLVIPNTLQVSLNWFYGTTPWAVNVLHYRVALGGAVDQAFTNAVDSEVKAALTASGLLSRLSTTWGLNSVSVRDIRSPNLPLYTGTGAQLNGTNAANPMPPQNACCVTLRTAKAGKSYRGRVYVSGFTEDINTPSGLILQAAATDAEDFIEGIANLENLSIPYGLDLAVASRTLGLSEPVTGVVVRDLTWDAQRRRRDGIAGF